MVSSSMVRGCLLGVGVGDALGAPIEFMSLSHIRQLYGDAGVTGYVEMDDHGYITDDTQMTLFTAEGIMLSRERGTEAVDEVFYAYERWLETQGIVAPPTVARQHLEDGNLHFEGKLQEQRAPGSTCLSALMRRRESILDMSQPLNNSKGCGTVMRMTPVGLFYAPHEAFVKGVSFSALTHSHPTGYLAGGATAMIESCLVRGKAMKEAVAMTLERLSTEPYHEETSEALRLAVSCAGDSSMTVVQAMDRLGDGWVAEEALAVSVYCALKFAGDFRKGVLAAVNISGDSDSTGALTGGFMGTILGASAIPQVWIDSLYERDVIEDVCEQIVNQL